MKAAIYCRLSKEDEDKIGESESIQNQKSMLLQYAIEKGFDIYQIYSDEDYSGIDRNRPAFNSMLQAASEHQFDVVLAKTQSRFTRDMELVEKYLHGKFIEWGIRFIAVVDHVDTNDTANKKSRQINGLINEWYLEDLSTNVRSVLDHKRKEGLFIGSFALYGYCKDPEAKGKLVVDPEAAEIVKRIFSMSLSGIGAHKIARILNDEKVPSPTAYKQMNGIHYHIAAKNRNVGLWSSPTVYQMLHNQTYAGNLVQGRHKKISYKTEKTMWLPKSQWIVVENTHEAIIERETFETVQRMMQGRDLCASMGFVTAEQLHRLHEAGVTSYHHNIETSRRNFPNICTTHTYDMKINTLKMIKAEGMCACSGGIIGMGETWEDRLDMAVSLAELGIDSIPLNALMPIPGTPLEHLERISEDDILRTIAFFRYINPEANIRLGAGRALLTNDGETAFCSGASATITGNMLTTVACATIRSDKKMLKGLGRNVTPEYMKEN